MTMKEWFGNAFSSPTEKDLTQAELDREERLFHKIAREVVERRLTVPALMFPEMHVPLGYVASQFAHSLGPFASLIMKPEDAQAFAEAIGRRDGIDKLMRIIDTEDNRYNSTEKSDDAEHGRQASENDSSQQKAEREV